MNKVFCRARITSTRACPAAEAADLIGDFLLRVGLIKSATLQNFDQLALYEVGF